MKALKALLVLIGLLISFAIIFSSCKKEETVEPEPDPMEEPMPDPEPLTLQQALDSLTPYTGNFEFTKRVWRLTSWEDYKDTTVYNGTVTIEDTLNLRLRFQYDSTDYFIWSPTYRGENGTCYSKTASISKSNQYYKSWKHSSGTPCSNLLEKDELTLNGRRL